MLLYVSWPAVSQSDSFMCFWAGSFFEGEGGGEAADGLLMLRAWEAGGPTGTMRDPNSTPMVTSWCGEKRPSQRRTVSWEGWLAWWWWWERGRRFSTLDLPQPESPKETDRKSTRLNSSHMS